VMAVLVLAALLLEREASVTNSLALAALAILAIRPGDLLDPGFQLSFAATAGIVAAPMPRGVIAGAIAVSAAAQLAVLPITLTHFNQLSTIGVVVNLGVVPLAGVATVAGLLAVAASFLSAGAAQIGFDAVWPVLLALRAVVALAAAVLGAVVYLPAPHGVAIAFYAGALALGLVWWRLRVERPRVGGPSGAAALILLVLAVAVAVWPLLRPPDGRLRVIVLDVGQGDAIVVEAPDGRVLPAPAGAATTRPSCCASSTGSRRSCSRLTSRPRASRPLSPRGRRSPRPSSRSRTTGRARRAPPRSSAPLARRSP